MDFYIFLFIKTSIIRTSLTNILVFFSIFILAATFNYLSRRHMQPSPHASQRHHKHHDQPHVTSPSLSSDVFCPSRQQLYFSCYCFHTRDFNYNFNGQYSWISKMSVQFIGDWNFSDRRYFEYYRRFHSSDSLRWLARRLDVSAKRTRYWTVLDSNSNLDFVVDSPFCPPKSTVHIFQVVPPPRLQLRTDSTSESTEASLESVSQLKSA